MAGTTRPARTYLATSQASNKGVVHGTPDSVLQDEFRRDLLLRGAKTLHVKRNGTVLVTVEGTTLPYYAL